MDNIKNVPKMSTKTITIIIGILVIVVALIVIFSNKDDGAQTPETSQTGTEQQPTNGQPGQQATNTPAAPVSPADSAMATQELKEARVVVPGANPISKDNVVLTQTGEVAQNNLIPMAPGAPQQTAPVSKDQIPASAVKLDVSAAGFSPSEFTVKPGAPVTLSVSSIDASTHVFMFDEFGLSAVAIGVGPGETRAITFNAPTKVGDYTFRCDVPGHGGRGEVGKMIVK